MDFAARRRRLLASLQEPCLLASGGALSRNYPANAFPFRADSNFLYFFERPEAGMAAFLDPADGSVHLFAPARTVEDALWHGELEPFEALRARHRVDQVLGVEQLEDHVRRLAKGRTVHALAVADPKWTARAAALTGRDLRFDDAALIGSPVLVDAIARLRLRKDAGELAEIERAAEVTAAAHLAAIRHTRVGVTEQELAGQVEGTFARAGCVPAYQTILSARSEVLHNHGHEGVVQAGDLLLLDGGAEVASGYCADVTRCWPASGAFSPEAREVYELVLRAQLAAIAAVKPGLRFRDLHLRCARVLAEGLRAMGLLRGSPDALVEAGAHALFFPHGLGHQLGLDVHDLEAFGDRVLYPQRQRSTQFGTAYLRMDMDLDEGMTFTVEPGVYFVPAILRAPTFRAQFAAMVDFDAAERFLALNGGRGLGGVRIEDDVVVTRDGCHVLTGAIPKARAEIEALVGTHG